MSFTVVVFPKFKQTLQVFMMNWKQMKLMGQQQLDLDGYESHKVIRSVCIKVPSQNVYLCTHVTRS